MQISWQPGFSTTRKPRKRQQAHKNRSGVRKDSSKFRYVEFDQHISRNDYTSGTSPSVSPEKNSQTPCALEDEPSIDVGRINEDALDRHHDEVACASPLVCSTPLEHEENGEGGILLSNPDMTPEPNTLIRSSQDNQNLRRNHSLQQLLFPLDDQTRFDALPSSHFPRRPQSRMLNLRLVEADSILADSCSTLAFKHPFNLSISIPKGPLYNDLCHRFEPVFNRYDQEFCKIPLTVDMCVNPFRCRSNLGDGPMLLLHAVMALGGHHVESSTSRDHQETALSLLRGSLTSSEGVNVQSLIDAIIVLFSYDEAQSIFGNWSMHLLGAYGLLEASGGVHQWLVSLRAQTQLALLTWWDALLSLVSRQDCIFPMAYFEALDAISDQRQWDHYTLSGCPMPLVRVTMRLARMSAAKRKCALIDYVVFDDTAVSDAERSLVEWQHVSNPLAIATEEEMQQDQDRMHCSEAWRCGLLLYVYRVFRWKPGATTPISILYRAREVVDHIFACRTETLVAKQALLPLFLAACELKDLMMRERIKQFCDICDKRSRYHMFNGAVALLEEIWAEQETHGHENVWWGSVVEKYHYAQASEMLPRQISFG